MHSATDSSKCKTSLLQINSILCNLLNVVDDENKLRLLQGACLGHELSPRRSEWLGHLFGVRKVMGLITCSLQSKGHIQGENWLGTVLFDQLFYEN